MKIWMKQGKRKERYCRKCGSCLLSKKNNMIDAQRRKRQHDVRFYEENRRAREK